MILAVLLLAQQIALTVRVDVPDLTANDFEVTVGGRKAQIESVAWKPVKREGRLLLLFIDAGFVDPELARDAQRVARPRFNAAADEIVALLGPKDRLAVVSYDTRLRLHADFTSDREVLRAAIRGANGVPAKSGPSLARHLDEEAMRTATSGEAAMELVARALEQVEGEPVIIRASLMDEDVDSFRSVLAEPQREKGSYELVLRIDPALEPGSHDVTVRTTRREANVRAPRSIVVQESEPVAVDRIETGVSARQLFTEAMRLLQSGKAEGVEALLDAAIAADPSLEEAWYERGMLALTRGDNEAAARDLRRYLELAPKGKHAADAREVLRSLSP